MPNKKEIAKIAKEIKTIKSELSKFAAKRVRLEEPGQMIARVVAKDLGFKGGKSTGKGLNYKLSFSKTVKKFIPNRNKLSEDEPDLFHYEIDFLMYVDTRSNVSLIAELSFGAVVLEDEMRIDTRSSNKTSKELEELMEIMEEKLERIAEEEFLG